MIEEKKRSEIITGSHASSLLDSKRLFYFFHVARLGSLTLAESVLGVAQSAISRQLQQLEAEFGVQLLQRTGRGVVLTEVGEMVYRQAELILRQMERTHDLVTRLKQRPSSARIAIAAPPIFANTYMPDAVQTFIQRFPDVKVDAYEASTGVVYEYLATGKVDIAIVLQSTASSKLVLQKLITEPLLLMVGKSHPLALANSVRRETLGELDLTMPSTLHGSRALLERYCEDGGVQLDPRLRLDSLAMTKAVVTSGRVCAVLPAQAFVSEIERGEIIALPLRPALKRTVYLATLKDRHVTPQIRAMALEITRVVKGKLATSQAKF